MTVPEDPKTQLKWLEDELKSLDEASISHLRLLADCLLRYIWVTSPSYYTSLRVIQEQHTQQLLILEEKYKSLRKFVV